MLKLSELVEEHVKSYKSDFYHWDNYFIGKDNIRKFIIVLRESGIHLLTLKSDINYSESNKNTVVYFTNNSDSSRKYFLCDMDDESVKQITLNDVIQYIQ